jgi:ABC-2 type transport system ATP-binding protein
MGQRLGVAAALLGDPATLVLDEPVNGLDPQGILWIRTLLRGLAAEGRTVLISSHLMSEMALTAEHLIVIGRGRLIADTSVQKFIDQASTQAVRVRTQRATELRDLLVGPLIGVTSVEQGLLEVTGLTSTQIGDVACQNGIALVELTPVQASLEEAFMELTDDAVEYRTDQAVQQKEAS